MLAIIAPQNSADLPVFYLFWVLLYFAIHIIWDVNSSRTPAFHPASLSSKTPVAFSAASFASSLLLVVGLADKDTLKVAGDTFVPILLAGLSGLLLGIGELCPYKLPPAGSMPPPPAVP